MLSYVSIKLWRAEQKLKSRLMIYDFMMLNQSLGNEMEVIFDYFRYWGNTAAKGENTDEMLPIVE